MCKWTDRFHTDVFVLYIMILFSNLAKPKNCYFQLVSQLFWPCFVFINFTNVEQSHTGHLRFLYCNTVFDSFHPTPNIILVPAFLYVKENILPAVVLEHYNVRSVPTGGGLTSLEMEALCTQWRSHPCGGVGRPPQLLASSSKTPGPLLP